MSVPVCALLSVRGRHRARSEIWEGAASTSRATAASRYQQPAQKQSTAVRLPRGSSGRFQSSFIVRAAAEDPLAPGDGASERKRRVFPRGAVQQTGRRLCTSAQNAVYLAHTRLGHCIGRLQIEPLI